MNFTTKIIFIVFICLILIYHLIENRENWVPWVWNIPTRDIYPKLYYDPRCTPPILHYYRGAPLHVNSPFFRESQIAKLDSMYNYYPSDPMFAGNQYSNYVYLDYHDLRNPYICPY